MEDFGTLEWIPNPILTGKKKAVKYNTAEEIATLKKLLKGLLIELNALKREYLSKRTSKERRKEIAEDIHFYITTNISLVIAIIIRTAMKKSKDR